MKARRELPPSTAPALVAAKYTACSEGVALVRMRKAAVLRLTDSFTPTVEGWSNVDANSMVSVVVGNLTYEQVLSAGDDWFNCVAGTETEAEGVVVTGQEELP